jgi:hypothetical protein
MYFITIIYINLKGFKNRISSWNQCWIWQEYLLIQSILYYSASISSSENLHLIEVHLIDYNSEMNVIFLLLSFFYYVWKKFLHLKPYVYVVQLIPVIDNTIYILMNSNIEKQHNNHSFYTLYYFNRIYHFGNTSNISFLFSHLNLIDFLTLVQLVVLRRVFILNDIHPIKSLLK